MGFICLPALITLEARYPAAQPHATLSDVDRCLPWRLEIGKSVTHYPKLSQQAERRLPGDDCCCQHESSSRKALPILLRTREARQELLEVSHSFTTVSQRATPPPHQPTKPTLESGQTKTQKVTSFYHIVFSPQELQENPQCQPQLTNIKTMACRS